MEMMDFHRAAAHGQQPLCQQHGGGGGAVHDGGGGEAVRDGGAVNDAGDEIKLSEWPWPSFNLQ